MMVSTTAAHTASRTRQRVAEIVADQGREAERAHLVRRLASALLQLLHISPGEDTLVTWLGDKDCHCNVEAVRAWIKLQLEDPELACSTSNPQILVGALAQRLQHRLFAIEDALA
jgi:hypothetical protein